MFDELPAIKKNPLIKKGLSSDEEIIRMLPRDYKDYSHVTALAKCVFPDKGQDIAVIGKIKKIRQKKNNGRTIVIVRCEEKDTDTPFMITYINMYNVANRLAGISSDYVLFRGLFRDDPTYGYSSVNPLFSSDIEGGLRIVPVYPKISRVAPATFQKEIADIMAEGEEDTVPSDLRGNMLELNEAFAAIHSPNDLLETDRGRIRLEYDDLVYLNLELMTRNRLTRKGIVMKNRKETDAMISRLPYRLTHDQMSAIDMILNKMSSGRMLNALVQGDVGAGKTIVAFSAMRFCAENGYQSTIMAPSQVLASQHYESLSQLVPSQEIAYLDSSVKGNARKQALSRIKDGTAKYIVGTHALISAGIEYHSAGLVIIDEEHRFGVEQRSAVMSSGCHVVTMSATPIPRSYAKAIYGEDTEIFQIKEKPANRIEVKTLYDNGSKVEGFMKRCLESNGRIYVVCPLIAHDNDVEATADLHSAEDVYLHLEGLFGSYGVGLVTGDTSSKQKDAVIRDFSTGALRVLVSTTVIEVGVNVPEANLIVVMDAERFGLATLHQLRGRVGRKAGKISYCVLVSDEVNDRIRAMCSTSDGFQIAEIDLIERKAGNLIGLEQSGRNKLVEMMFSKPMLNARAKEAAAEMMRRGIYEKHLLKYRKIYCKEDYSA